MAGVDHAYQYSVEVKSRFSLFLDDTLNSEDPDILLSKLQSKRSEKTKKDKSHVQQQHVAPAKVDTTTKNEVKVETAAPKGKQMCNISYLSWLSSVENHQRHRAATSAT